MQRAQRVFGLDTAQAGRAGKDNGTRPEALVVSGTLNARRVRGPDLANWSAHVYVTAASGATSAMTVWYSNLPNPDPAVDADWFQDPDVAAVDLTLVAGKVINVGNCHVEWVRFKPVVVTTAGSMYLWYRAD